MKEYTNEWQNLKKENEKKLFGDLKVKILSFAGN